MSFPALSAFRALGLTSEEFIALRRACMDHADAPRGVQLNGGCREGRCDFVPPSPKCMAWTRLCDLIRDLAQPPR